ncbi:MAG: alpha/beta fold hydrolase [Paracoccaceae bacterium]
MLRTIISGQMTEKNPLLIAHGLFGSARNWGVIAKRLSDTRQVVSVDMRNHGESEWFQSHSYHEQAVDLAEIITEFDGKMDVLGHSMGGKAAMVLAVSRPEMVGNLVIADISPVVYRHTQAHLTEAMQNLDMTRISSRSDAEKQLLQSINEASVRAFLLQSLDIKEKKWRLNLDVLAEEMETVIGFPEIEGRFDGPALFLTGADSNYVSIEHRPEIKRLFPKARFAKIPGTGHWLHAEKPREFEAAVRVFLDR